MQSRKLPSWMLKNNSKIIESNVGSPNVADAKAGIEDLEYPGKIEYCYRKDECNFVCHDWLKSGKPLVFGFDMEWKVTYEVGVYHTTATLQLCPDHNKCYIFHLSQMNGFPSELKKLLERNDVLKVGIGIQGDMNRLSMDYKLTNISDAVDLSDLANEKLSTGENWSLNGLLNDQLEKGLQKDSKVRCSDWESFPLSEKQLRYAALDAYSDYFAGFLSQQVRGPHVANLEIVYASKRFEHYKPWPGEHNMERSPNQVERRILNAVWIYIGIFPYH